MYQSIVCWESIHASLPEATTFSGNRILSILWEISEKCNSMYLKSYCIGDGGQL